MAIPIPTSSQVGALNTNLTSLVAATTAAAALANIALVIPISADPSSTVGYVPEKDTQTSVINYLLGNGPALLFHFEGENTTTIESDITDHYVEDNTTVVDQIGLKPELVTVTGYIGELNNVLPPPLQILQTIANSLLLVNSYQPAISVTALNALNEAEFLYQGAQSIKNSAVAAWSSITRTPGNEVTPGTGVFTVGAAAVQNKQQGMFQQFYGYWHERRLFTVQTPWAVFNNMAIKSVRAIQDEATRVISTFEVTFKKIRTATTKTSLFENLSQGRTATQSAGLVNSGTTSGTPGSSLGALTGGI